MIDNTPQREDNGEIVTFIVKFFLESLTRSTVWSLRPGTKTLSYLEVQTEILNYLRLQTLMNHKHNLF